MIFFFNANGELINSIPKRVFQGSNKANTIYVCAPLSPSLATTISFSLPDGTTTQQGLMTSSTDNPITEMLDACRRKFSVWAYDIPSIVTARAGTVTAQVTFTNSEETIASEKIEIFIEKGIAPTEVEDIKTLEEIKKYLVEINSDLSTLDEYAKKEDLEDLSVEVVQTTGDSETAVMSQKATTKELDKKVDNSSILQTTGDSETAVMSQKAVTEELNKKLDTSGGTMAGPLTFTSDKSIVNNSTANTIHLLTSKGYNIVTYSPNTKVLSFGVSSHKCNLRGTSLAMNGEDIKSYLGVTSLYKHLLPLGERDWFDEGFTTNAWLEIIDDSDAEYTNDGSFIYPNGGNIISAKVYFDGTNPQDNTWYSVLLSKVGTSITSACWLMPYANTFKDLLGYALPSDFEDTVIKI